MSTTVLPHASRPGAGGAAFNPRSVAAVLLAWAALVLLIGAAGGLGTAPGTPPWPIGLGVTLPLAAFFLLLRVSKGFRAFVLGVDLRFAATVQAWRWAGLGFISLYAHGVLPGIFAWPAGLGDMAIGFTAPAVVLALTRDPDFAATRAFRRWNLFGILDLVVAVSIGTLSSAFGSTAPGAITTAPMAQLPLALIPTFLVPVFIMLHAAALMQGRRLAKTASRVR